VAASVRGLAPPASLAHLAKLAVQRFKLATSQNTRILNGNRPLFPYDPKPKDRCAAPTEALAARGTDVRAPDGENLSKTPGSILGPCRDISEDSERQKENADSALSQQKPRKTSQFWRFPGHMLRTGRSAPKGTRIICHKFLWRQRLRAIRVSRRCKIGCNSSLRRKPTRDYSRMANAPGSGPRWDHGDGQGDPVQRIG
jgi:hypothetical protein